MRSLFFAVYLIFASVFPSFARVRSNLESNLARAQTNLEFDELMNALWATEECEKFVSDQNWTIVATGDCTVEKCNSPREVCVERVEMTFSDEGRQRRCRVVPDKCFRAAYGEESGSDASIQETESVQNNGVDAELKAEREEVCSQPRDSGKKCVSYLRSFPFFFDGRRGHCARMLYLGCGGNGNRFATHEQCIFSCASSSVVGARELGHLDNESKKKLESGRYRPQRCRMEKRSGNRKCREAGLKRKFYFDQRIGDCNMFFWWGCAGNKNQFNSIRECRSVCRV